MAQTYTYYIYHNDGLIAFSRPAPSNTTTLFAFAYGSFSVGVVVQTTDGRFISGMSDLCYVGAPSGGLSVMVSAAPTSASVGTQVTWQAFATGNSGPVSWFFELHSPNGLYDCGYSNYVSLPVTASGTWYASFTATDSISSQSTTGGYVNVSAGGSGNDNGGEIETATGTVFLSSGTLNVRSGPSTTYSAVGSLVNGQTVTYITNEIFNDGRNWNQLLTPMSGYVASQYVQRASSGGNPGAGSFVPGHLGITNKNGVTIFKTPAVANDNMGRFIAGCKFVIEGVDGQYVRVKFGKTTQGTDSRYVPISDFEDCGVPPASNAEVMRTIAQSLLGMKGVNIGLNGDYCQNFMYWLAGASGRTINNLPYGNGYCQDALNYFIARGEAFAKNDANKRPRLGDWVYYNEIGGSRACHTGLVAYVNGNTFVSYEGNYDANYSIGLASGNHVTGVSDTHGNKTVPKQVLCFVRPSYT